jgi:hypothetical protein
MENKIHISYMSYRRSLLEIHWHRWENTAVDTEETGCEAVDSIELAQNRFQ